VLHPIGPGAGQLATLWWTMFALGSVVYVVVAGFIIAGAVRGRGSDDGRPSRITDNAFVWVGGIAVPLVIIGFLAVLTVHASGALGKPSGRALSIEVTGKQWWWQVAYPSQAIVTANEIHVPVGQPVAVSLHTADVIHSFWVPALNGKLDVIPDHVNVLRFRVDKAGTYRGVCAEYCGIQHANMNFLVIGQSPAAFSRWVAQHRQPATAPSSEDIARGQAAFMTAPCAGCHTIRGTQANGARGPDLSDVGGRRYLGAGAIPNERAFLEAWIRDAPHFKRGVLMPPIQLSDADAAAIVAYLESLK
jgi:cytochrome c oxidase subunit II